ncbi:unnamed protein product, partial [marine sediment metagenome]
MARQVVIQSDGKYSCWSTIVDNFVWTDATREEYINARAKECHDE